ncbi:MAG: silent information regulator protein Sir2 [Luteitalea sp.]|nr:silent information regulator protein Sir2 [Luteitalea sp.]
MHALRVSLALAVAAAALSPWWPLSAADAPETLDRGLVAVPTGQNEVYVGWRLLKTDPSNVGFNVYRSTAGQPALKLNETPVTESTNFVDRTAPLSRENAWSVRAVTEGSEQDASDAVRLLANAPTRPYVTMKLQGDYSPNKIGIADLDGDGKLDFVVKQPGSSIDPGDSYWRRSTDTYKLEAYRNDGTLLWRKDLGWNIEMGIWYSPMVVFDLNEDGKAEIALRTAPTDVDYRDADGHMLTGPEYLSILDGMTGSEITKVDWIARGNVADWGDETGNRASRHMVGVAYLDGKRPSIVVHRGTYTTMRVDTYNLVDGQLKKVWSWNGDDEDPQVRGQGMHGMKVADIDDDGRDELVLGAAALDDNGTLLWNTDLGHPDVVYVADVDPDRAGLEIAYGVEVRRKENGICLVEARTGKIIWGLQEPTTHIHDQGMLGDLDAGHPGMEFYGVEADGSQFWLHNARGERLGAEDLGGISPRALYWDDGPIKAYIPGRSRFRRPAGSRTQRAADRPRPRPSGVPERSRIVKYKGPQLGEIEGRIVGLADIVGDWREEVVTAVDGELRIYTTTIPATSRRVALMQDRVYRIDTALQAMAYFYPPQVGGTLFDVR